MVRGFYEIGSGMMANQKLIDTIANNIANANTAGYKAQESVTVPFDEMLTYRLGTTETGADHATPLYDRSWINVVSDTVTNFDQGPLKLTERPLDFGITGKGFFQIKTKSGQIGYTRNGSFDLDEEGYLYLTGAGRVQGPNGDIFIGTDNIITGSNGEIYNADTDQYYGKIALYDFEDYGNLVEFNNNMYKTTETPFVSNAEVRNYRYESSNIDLAEEITSAMRTENLIQSQANILQMYADVLKDGTQRISAIK